MKYRLNLCKLVHQVKYEELQQTYNRLTPRYQQLAAERKDMQLQLSQMHHEYEKAVCHLNSIQNSSL